MRVVSMLEELKQRGKFHDAFETILLLFLSFRNDLVVGGIRYASEVAGGTSSEAVPSRSCTTF